MNLNRHQITGAVLGVLVGLLLLIVVTSVVVGAATSTQVRNTQVTNTRKADQNAQILREVRSLARAIRSCTTPGRACSERGRRQTANAVAVIGAGNRAAAAAAAACAARIDTPNYPRVLACVNKALADTHKPGARP